MYREPGQGPVTQPAGPGGRGRQARAERRGVDTGNTERPGRNNYFRYPAFHGHHRASDEGLLSYYDIGIEVVHDRRQVFYVLRDGRDKQLSDDLLQPVESRLL